jgi:hypothetical protein
MILCDAADQVGGKLYILGGGWNQATTSEPMSMSLAVVIEVPWDQTGQQLTLRAGLQDEDGAPVVTNGQPVAAEAQLEVARPATGVKPGSDLNVPIALRFNGLQLGAGRYTWVLIIGDDEVARCTFAVLAPA